MRIQRSAIGGIEALDVRGELDHSSAVEVAEAVGQARARGAERLIFDFTHLTYIDSAGISVLYEAVRTLREGWVGVLNPDGNVRRILELGGIIHVPQFLIFDSIEEAEHVTLRRGSET